jgi:hypothetical protein
MKDAEIFDVDEMKELLILYIIIRSIKLEFLEELTNFDNPKAL